MLKELFEAHFYGTFHRVDDKELTLNESILSGRFSLLDATACQGCKYVCNEDSSAREQLKVHGPQSVSVLSMNQVFSFVSEDVGEICDFMLEGQESTTLVEMTCSSIDYVKDKRHKARGQLYNTLTLLHTNPIVRKHLQDKELRYAVFSWRDTSPVDVEDDDVERSMKDMTLMTDEIYSPDNESKFDFDFRLREIRYPDVLTCF